jgi:type III pantothenate kinase
VNGLVFEIDGFIEAYKAKYSNFIIILTGGDADFWLNEKYHICQFKFSSESLNQTFQYKIKND